METDIGNPIEYDPTIDNLKDDKSEDHDTFFLIRIELPHLWLIYST